MKLQIFRSGIIYDLECPDEDCIGIEFDQVGGLYLECRSCQSIHHREEIKDDLKIMILFDTRDHLRKKRGLANAKQNEEA